MITLKNLIYSIIIPIVIASCALRAQEKQDNIDPFTFNAQLRMRPEADNRDLSSRTRINTYTAMRTRLSITASPLKNASAMIQFQDSRIFGQEKSPTDDSKNVDLHQAYIELKQFLWNKLDIRAGRTEIAYDNERLIGSSNWNQVGRAFDGIRATIRLNDRMHLDGFGFQVEEKSVPPNAADSASLSKSVPDQDDRWLTGLYFKYTPTEMNNLSVYIMSDRDGTKKTTTTGSQKDSLSRVTTGFYGKYSYNGFIFISETAYQFGSVTGNHIRAYMVTASLAYLFKERPLNPEITIGGDILSGDNKTSDSYARVFNTLYASNHKNYGYMDYFLDIPKHTKNLGLRDAFLKIKINPLKTLKVELAYHNFSSQKKHLGYNSRFFGHETDLMMQYRFNKHFQWEQGASVFIPGKLMKQYIGGRDTGYWLYGSALFTI